MSRIALAWFVDPRTCRLPLADVARTAADAGADADVVRGRASDAAATDLAGLLVTVLAGTPMRVLVSERFDVALAAGAAGVHLKDAGLSPREMRAAAAAAGAPAGFLVGASTHDGGRLAEVAREGAGHATIGPLRDAHGKRGRGEDFVRAALDHARAAGGLPPSVLLLGGVEAADAALALRLARPGERIGLAAIRLFQDAATLGEVAARVRTAASGLGLAAADSM